jgi:hypothetical protein
VKNYYYEGEYFNLLKDGFGILFTERGFFFLFFLFFYFFVFLFLYQLLKKIHFFRWIWRRI